jgi:hypothetical protein
MWWLIPLIKYIKRKFGLVYVIMRVDYSAYLSFSEGPIRFYSRKWARDYAEHIGGHAVTLRKANKILRGNK